MKNRERWFDGIFIPVRSPDDVVITCIKTSKAELKREGSSHRTNDDIRIITALVGSD